MTDTKSWYTSKTVWTVLVMLLSVMARNFGIDLGPFEKVSVKHVAEVVKISDNIDNPFLTCLN